MHAFFFSSETTECQEKQTNKRFINADIARALGPGRRALKLESVY